MVKFVTRVIASQITFMVNQRCCSCLRYSAGFVVQSGMP